MGSAAQERAVDRVDTIRPLIHQELGKLLDGRPIDRVGETLTAAVYDLVYAAEQEERDAIAARIASEGQAAYRSLGQTVGGYLLNFAGALEGWTRARGDKIT